MQFAHASLTLLHLVGFAALFGAVLVQLRSAEPEVNRAMLVGAPVMLITGVVGWVLDPGGRGVAPFVVSTIDLAFATVLVAVNRRYASIPRGLLLLIGILAFADAAIAVYWT